MNVPEPQWPGVPQLRMRRPSLDALPSIGILEPYRIRTYQSGDEAPWLILMRATFGPSWTTGRWQTDLIARPQFDAAGLFMAVRDDVLVGSACAWRLEPGEQTVGYIQLVAVDPGHRGHKLGYWLTLSVLRYFLDQGLHEAILDTEDHRLAAIELYLRLGFEPLDRHATHPARWGTIYAQLGRRRPT